VYAREMHTRKVWRKIFRRLYVLLDFRPLGKIVDGLLIASFIIYISLVL
jgi:hypothetical protein